MQSSTVVLEHHTGRFQWRSRLRAAAIHLALSVAVAGLAGLLVFALWYPYPYREISGGRELFLLVVAVDIVIGPLITFAVFNRAKPVAELRRDLAVVAPAAAGRAAVWTVDGATGAAGAHRLRVRPLPGRAPGGHSGRAAVARRDRHRGRAVDWPDADRTAPVQELAGEAGHDGPGAWEACNCRPARNSGGRTRPNGRQCSRPRGRWRRSWPAFRSRRT